MQKYRFSALALAALLLTGCGSGYSKQTADLTAGIKTENAAGTDKTDDFIDAQFQFTLSLLQAGDKLSPDENLAFTPYLAAQTLMLAANGAGGDTRSEIEALFGGMETAALNDYLACWRQGLPAGQLTAANSVWVKDADAEHFRQDYLETAQASYGAEVYSAAFDAESVTDMNQWVSNATDGAVTELVRELDPNETLDLLSAAVFDAAWKEKYADNEVANILFYCANGQQKSVQALRKEKETAIYLEDGEKAVGLMRDYEGQRFRFGALMPVGMPLDEYISGLTPEHLREVLNSGRETELDTGIPVFTLDTDNDLKPILQEMGVQTVFEPGSADFSAMCDLPLYLDRSVQRAQIAVDRHGTNASFALNLKAEVFAAAEYRVYLDRPFVWFIYDRAYGLPVMIGTVENPG